MFFVVVACILRYLYTFELTQASIFIDCCGYRDLVRCTHTMFV